MEMKELLIILAVVLVVFGAKKVRTIGEDLGHAVRGFKKAVKAGEEEDDADAAPRRQVGSNCSDAEFVGAAKAARADVARRSDRSDRSLA